MSHICSLTNQPTDDAVVSTKSGYIFDRQTIEKHLESDSTDPKTNKPLTKEDLVPLQVAKPNKQKTQSDTSVSGLISVFQGEWDSAMLEGFTLKQNLETVRKELSHALYQHDAACRTIARLIKEKDDAKRTLTDLVAKKKQASTTMRAVPQGGAKEFPERMIRDIYDLRIELSKMRKEFENNDKALLAYSSQEMILNYRLTTSVTLHSESKSGITCLDINNQLDDLLLTGGQDGTVVIYNCAQDKVINTFKEHTKPVTGVSFIPIRTREGRQVLGFTVSEDGVAYAFVNDNETGEIKVTYKHTGHSAGLTGCAVHPISYFGIVCSRDGSFSCHDLARNTLLTTVVLDKNVPITTMAIHPDGEIAAFAGEDGTVKIWDIPQLIQIGSLQAHETSVESISFSEDGKFLATSSSGDKAVKLWDLRKLGNDNYRVVGEGVSGTLSFDKTGRYLAIGSGASLTLYNSRTLDQFTKIDAHQSNITAIKFGTYSKYIATVSADSHLNIFS